jgi:hypothetical protein
VTVPARRDPSPIQSAPSYGLARVQSEMELVVQSHSRAIQALAQVYGCSELVAAQAFAAAFAIRAVSGPRSESLQAADNDRDAAFQSELLRILRGAARDLGQLARR